MPHHKSKSNKEQLIWGEITHSHLGEDRRPARVDAGQISTDFWDDTSSARPRARRHTCPPHILSGRRDTSVSLSQSLLGLARSPDSASRRRLRGPDAGKSIHKAAEAPQISLSSVSAHSQERRRSLGLAQRIFPSNNFIEADIEASSTKGLLATYSGKVASTSTPDPPSRKRKRETQFGITEASLGITNPALHSPSCEHNSSHPSSDHSDDGSGPTNKSRASSPLESPASSVYQVQLARKSASRKALSKPEIIHHPRKSASRVPVKAARKTSAKYIVWPAGSSSSDDSDFMNSDDKPRSDGGQEKSHSSCSPVLEGNRPRNTNAEKYSGPQVLGDVSQSDAEQGYVIKEPELTNYVAPVFQQQRSRSSSSTRKPRGHSHLFPADSSNNEGDVSRSHAGEDIQVSSHSRYMSKFQEIQDPPQPLVSAFEDISAYTVHLYAAKRLPFLLRNVRAGFRFWCETLHVNSDPDYLQAHLHVTLIFEYTDPSGDFYAYNTEIKRWECPLCSILGILPSWERLRRHVQWDHGEVEFDATTGTKDNEVVVIRIRLPIGMQLKPPCLAAKPHKQKLSSTTPIKSPPESRFGKPAQFVQESPSGHLSFNPQEASLLQDEVSLENNGLEVIPSNKIVPDHHELPSPKGQNTTHQEIDIQKSPKSQSRSSFSIPESHHATRRTETSTSPQPATPQRGVSEVVDTHTPVSLHSSAIRSLPISPLNSEIAKSQCPPPSSHDRHGPSLPIVSILDHPLPNLMLPVTCRPTGPHLYDRLATLPLDAFGHQSWFILDKEEEIFELTDVLDEDKVMCALWGRWIFLNRSFFISNYVRGVEAFVDEYWLCIHQSAGWGALRAWLLMLVSRRFLKNVEMVQLLKRYNRLVGRDNWPKENK